MEKLREARQHTALIAAQFRLQMPDISVEQPPHSLRGRFDAVSLKNAMGDPDIGLACDLDVPSVSSRPKYSHIASVSAFSPARRSEGWSGRYRKGRACFSKSGSRRAGGLGEEAFTESPFKMRKNPVNREKNSRKFPLRSALLLLSVAYFLFLRFQFVIFHRQEPPFPFSYGQWGHRHADALAHSFGSISV